MLSLIIEYRYGSRYSYPPATEAEARQQAVLYCMTAAEDHWSRTQTRLGARIYPFGGMIREDYPIGGKWQFVSTGDDANGFIGVFEV